MPSRAATLLMLVAAASSGCSPAERGGFLDAEAAGGAGGGGHVDDDAGAEDAGAPDAQSPDAGCALGEILVDGGCAPNFPSCAGTGGCLPDQAFCDDVGRYAVTDEVVVDEMTGLLWERHGPTVMMTFAEAQAHCDGLTLAGLTGWRIPVILELTTIVHMPGGLMGCAPGYCCPAVDQSAFPGTPADLFWSSTMTGPGPDLVYCLQFADGRYSNWKTPVTDSEYIRCVHDPLH